ncbi:AI-2E family transporter [Geobacter sp. DSM 9736]|uniref:AI-2E family transporter n=1 Tax=Geobacter sp. DSM 9736 TaxID=1277350 RepID=UPI000B506888|nr:AI-2E family transporter [Geobacter sp. DSM 9736]SNB47661.1 Predicted PurR-regulated permease PerM [Geobacter sp. DSM 9736]
MDRKIYLSILAALATAAIIWLLFLLIAPFAMPFVWALVVGLATYPYYERIEGRFRGHPDRAASLMVGLVTLGVILPAAILIFMIAQNAAVWYYESAELFRSLSTSGTSVLNRVPFGDRILSLVEGTGFDITEHAAQIAGTASQFLLNMASSTVRNVAQFMLTLAMSIFILYFIYRDGARVVDAGVRRFADDPGTIRHYLTKIRSTTTAVVVGTILTCLVQGALAGVGYFFAGVPAPVLFGLLTAIGALVPVVGTALVWVPLVAYLALTGAYLNAGLLAGWCAIFVGISDNAIRPLTIGARSNIPTLAVVLGAVGGAATMGLLGLIVGPIVFAIMATLWRDATAEGGRHRNEHRSESVPPENPDTTNF